MRAPGMRPRTRACTDDRCLKSRYDAFAERVLASLSEIERRDVRAFDHWFYRERRLALAGRRRRCVTTLVAWIASRLPWNMSFAEAAILFNARRR